MGEPAQAIRIAKEYAAAVLPRPIRERVVDKRYSWNLSEMLEVAKPKPGRAPVRLLIAPANYASQGYYWARAAETLPGVSAVNMVFGHERDGITIAPDVSLPAGAARTYSQEWGRRQRREIIKNFTHVIYEAELPILYPVHRGDVVAEVEDLREHGVKVAMLSHGSDVRAPSKHVQHEPFSPFRGPLDGMTERLEELTAVRRATLDGLSVPKFVSTPDLLRYVPDAAWLPTLTDPKRWLALPPIELGTRKLRVVHIPSRSAFKGTAHIRSAMERLQDQGLIEYTELQGVPYDKMPTLVEGADVVIDQVSMGLYGVASVEAMLAGRIVVAQVGDFIRREVKERTGWDVPIVEANPQTIGEVVADIARDPRAYASTPTRGREYALAVHSDGYAADVLRPFLFSIE